jgi:6-phosphogluconolactonase
MIEEKMPGPDWHVFSSPAALAQALSVRLCGVLEAAIARRGTGLIAVSGGTTPALLFSTLARSPLDWAKVTVTLVDERMAPETSPRSNARLVRDRLLQDKAAAARFVGLYHGVEAPEEAATLAREKLRPLPFPLDAAVLGMGTDGHTASYFPDAADLDRLLDPEAKESVLPVLAESAGEPRLTLTLPFLAQAGFVALHIEGEEKKQVFEAAMAQRTGPFPPIRRVLDLLPQPVEVYWTAG